MYRTFLKPLLFRFDPEDVHTAFVALGQSLGRTALGRAIVALPYGYRGPSIEKTVDGIRYRTPVLLSAGFDYNAHLTQILPSLSFGGVEVGSITAQPCVGNPRPRLTRLTRSQSILVNKGLLNDGVDAIIARLAATPRVPGFVIGISIARANDPSAASVEKGVIDYVTSYRKLNERGIGDYYTINISCPNAYGGESFTTPDLLSQLLGNLRKIPTTRPLYIKMPINLPWEKTRELLDVIVRYRCNGVIIGNVNKNYNDLAVRTEAPRAYSGGLSGKPCFSLSNELIEKTKQAYGDRLTIIGCGGILSPEDAIIKFDRGADLVQLITGMIFEGPALMKGICKAYAARRGRNAG
jgi:dihydroorotate dehydrogenase